MKTIIAFSIALALLFSLQDAVAQERLLPNQTVAKSIESCKTHTYIVSLNDGDYVSGSINQHGKVNINILGADGSLLRSFPGPSGDAKRQFAFAAEGGGSYSISIANPGGQAVKYELLIEKILSLNARFRPEPWSDPYPSPRIQALRRDIAAGNSTEAFWKEMDAPLRFDLEAGVFELDRHGEGGDVLEPTRALRDVLLAKGYEVHYQEFVGGHDGLSWRGTLADSLIALLGARRVFEVR